MDPMQGTSVVVFAAGGGVVAIFADPVSGLSFACAGVEHDS